MGYLDDIRSLGRDANPFFREMGIDVSEYGDGKAFLCMEIRPGMKNGEGWLQGGLFVALADEAMALAAYTLLEPGETIATISESTSFLSGTREGKIYAEGRVIKRGRRVVFTEADVLDGPGGRTHSISSGVFAVSKQ